MVGTFPTAFALGEKFHLSGREVIELIIIGYEAAKLILALEDVKDVTQLMDIVTFPEGSR